MNWDYHISLNFSQVERFIRIFPDEWKNYTILMENKGCKPFSLARRRHELELERLSFEACGVHWKRATRSDTDWSLPPKKWEDVLGV